jgi:hypothetical protein
MKCATNELFQVIDRFSSRNIHNNFEARICFVFLLLHLCLLIVNGNEPAPINSNFLRANRLVEKQENEIVGFETSRQTHQSHQFALGGVGGSFRRKGTHQIFGPDHKIQFSGVQILSKCNLGMFCATASAGSILKVIASSLFPGTILDGLGYSLSAASAVDVFEDDVRSTIALGWKSGGVTAHMNGDMGAFFFSPDKIGRPHESVALISQTGDGAPEPAGIVIVASSPHSSCFAFKVT